MLAGGKFGGGEVEASWGSFPSDRLRVVDGVFSGEILVGLLEPTRCRLRVAPLLLEGHRGYLMSTSLGVPGETLGPDGSGNSDSPPS
jgi:hypothetical protein